MEETDAILNWGFNPSSKKSKDSILVTASTSDTENWPYKIFQTEYVFNNPEIFLEFTRKEDYTHSGDEFFKKTKMRAWQFNQLAWNRVKRILSIYKETVYPEGGEVAQVEWRGSALRDIISWTNNFDFESWIKTGRAPPAQDRLWEYPANLEDFAGDMEMVAYSIDLMVSPDIIIINIGENAGWGDPPWAFRYVIKKVRC